MANTKIRGNTQVMADTITNTEINSGAAIATSKLADSANFIMRGGAVAFTADQSMGSHKLTNVTDPVAAQDAATKHYVDAVAVGLDWKLSVRLATTGNLAGITGILTIDGQTTSTGDRILVKDQSTQTQNGIYLADDGGAWTRAPDFNTGTGGPGAAMTVEQGTVNADTLWVCTNDTAITFGVTNITFSPLGGSGVTAGAGLTKTGMTLDVVAADNSMTINADSIQVKRATTGKGNLEVVAGGLKVVDAPKFTTIQLNDGVGDSGTIEWDNTAGFIRIKNDLLIDGTASATAVLKIANNLDTYWSISPPSSTATPRTLTLPDRAGTFIVAIDTNTPLAYTAADNGQIKVDTRYLPVKRPVRVATTANITLSGTQTIDGVAVVAGDRVLVKNQSTATANGIYDVAAGAWARSSDADDANDVIGGIGVYVNEGSSLADTLWFLSTNDPITLGATSLTFTQFTGTGLLNTNFVVRETPSGLINGSNVTFTLANTPVSGSEELYLNGIQQDAGAGNDYTISGGTITMAAAPISGDKLRCTYRK